MRYPKQKVTLLKGKEKMNLNVSKKNYSSTYPDDIVYEILSFIPRDSCLRSLRLVSFQWNFLIQKNFPECLSFKKLTQENKNYQEIWEKEKKQLISLSAEDTLFSAMFFGAAWGLTGLPIPIFAGLWLNFLIQDGHFINLPYNVIQLGLHKLKTKKRDKMITDSSWVDVEANEFNVVIRKLDDEPVTILFNIDVDVKWDYFDEIEKSEVKPQSWGMNCHNCQKEIIGTKYTCQDCIQRPQICEECFKKHLQIHFFKTEGIYF